MDGRAFRLRVFPRISRVGAWTLCLWAISLGTAAPEAAGAEALSVEGRVQADGRALVGAEVLLFAGDGPAWLPASSDETGATARTVTDRRGRFGFELPRPGAWRLWIRAEGRAAVRSSVLPILRSVSLPPAELPVVETVEVRVSVSERPAAGAWIHWRAETPAELRAAWQPAPISSRTDSEGLGRAEWPRGFRSFIEVATQGARPLGVEMPADTRDPVEIALELLDRSTRVRLLDGRDRAQVGAWILTPFGTPVGRTSEEGEVDLPFPSPEKESLRVWTPGGRTADGLVGELTWTSDAGEDGVRVARWSSRRVFGRIVDNATGRPVAGAVVWSDVPFAAVPSVTLADGSYDSRVAGDRVAGDLPVELRVEARGYASIRLGVERSAAGTAWMQPLRVGVGRVEDLDGAGIPEARVTLRSGERSFHAETDEEGVFVVSNPETGLYDLEASAEGYQSVTLADAVRLADPGTDVKPGTDVDLGAVSLAPGLRLEGWVLDEWGSPVAEAEVALAAGRARDADDDGATPPRFVSGKLRVVTTNDEGRFVVDGLAPERLELRARKNGFRDARAEDVDPRDTPSIELTLESAPAVRGRVLSEDGDGVAGALLTVRPSSADSEADPEANSQGLDADSVRSTQADSVRSAQTDDLGSFELVGVPAGSFDLSVDAAGFRAAEWRGVKLDPETADEDLELVLQRGSTLAGRVLEGDGSFVVGASVRVRREGGAADPEADREAAGGAARSDARGRFEVPGLERGTYTVIAHDASGRSAERRLTLVGDEAEVELWLDGGVDVSGRVVDTDGRPVAGAEVQLSPVDPSRSAPSATSDAHGRFVVPRVAAGAYRLTASSPRHVASASAREIQVDHAPVTGLEAVLSEGVTLVGRVVGASFEELPHVVVRSVGPGQGAGTRVDAQGRFELAHLRPGELVIEAAVVGEDRSARQSLTLSPGSGPVEVELALPASR